MITDQWLQEHAIQKEDLYHSLCVYIIGRPVAIPWWFLEEEPSATWEEIYNRFAGTEFLRYAVCMILRQEDRGLW